MGEFKKYINQSLVGAGLGMATDLVGGFMGQMFADKNTKRQIAAQKEMADYNQALNMKMWKETNYTAQMNELKKAGLNPSIIYGGAGAQGGGNTVSTGNIGQSNAGENSNSGMQGIMAGLQAGMMEAQIEALKAGANKDNADAAATGGYKKDEAESNIAVNSQQIRNLVEQAKKTKAETTMVEWEAKLKEMEAALKAQTWEEAVNQIVWTSKGAKALAEKGASEAYIMEKSKEDLIQQNRATALLTAAQWITERKKPALMEMQKKVFAAQVVTGIADSASKRMDTLTNLKNQLTQQGKLTVEQLRYRMEMWVNSQDLDRKEKEMYIKGIDALIPF